MARLIRSLGAFGIATTLSLGARAAHRSGDVDAARYRAGGSSPSSTCAAPRPVSPLRLNPTSTCRPEALRDQARMDR